MLADFLALLARILTGASLRVADDVALAPENIRRQRVYIANHTSHLDFIVLWSALPAELRRRTRPAAAKDYWQATSLRRFLALKVYNAILVERKHVTASNNPVDALLDGIGDAHSLILFPEGTRGSGEEVMPFKSGIYHLCVRKPELECVPVYLENLNRILPKGEFLPLPLLGRITVGSPITLQPEERKEEFLARLREAVVELRNL